VTDRYKIDLDQLAAAIEAMHAFDHKAESIIAEVDRRVTALHVDSWSGEAATAQQDDHDRWTADAGRMREALGKLRDAGERAHGNYRGAHTTNTGMWDIT